MEIPVVATKTESDEKKLERNRTLLGQPADQRGHAMCVQYLFPDRFRYNRSAGWYFWNGRFWQTEGAEQVLGRAIEHTLDQRRQVAALMGKEGRRLYGKSFADESMISGVKRRLADRKDVFTPPSEFNRDLDLLNAANGVINLQTGELLPHHPQYMMTYALNTDYDPSARSPFWLEWLEELGFDSQACQYLQLCVGYSLTGHTNERAFFYLYGPTAAGKSTFLETIQALLRGPLEAGVSFSTFTIDRSGSSNSNFDLAPLKDARLIVASESERGRSMNEQTVKNITGGEEIYCSFKHRDMFSYRPKFKIWVSSNYPPVADPGDEAVWNRIHLIHFKNSFVGQIKRWLKDHLQSAEVQRGILAWAVQGAQAWYMLDGDGIKRPEEMEEELNLRRTDLDTVGQFIASGYTVIPATDAEWENSYIVSSALHMDYKNWCEEEGYRPYGRRRFTTALESYGISCEPKWVASMSKTKRCYVGIKEMVGPLAL